MKYRKKPVVIDAVQWTGFNHSELESFIDKSYIRISGDGSISIETLEGTMKANINDWIIKGVKGEYYPCRDDIFQETYERTGYE